MGNKKKKKKKETTKPKHVKSAAAVDERVKRVSELQPPDENPFKTENEKRIERFMRFGMKRKKKLTTIKNAARKK